MSLSLCICTMNRPIELATALESVRAGTAQPREIIVSDDGEGTARTVAQKFGARYVQGPRRGLGANRNACIAVASGATLAFIDDDVVVRPDFVAVAERTARDNAIVTGYEINHSFDPPKRVTPHNPSFLGFQKIPPGTDLRAIVINAATFPALLFDQAQFDDQVRYGYEEIDMTRHAMSLGYRVVFEPALGVHHHPSSLNRASYRPQTDAARLYLTYRAYREYEGRAAKATAFLAASGLHAVAHGVKRRDLTHTRTTLRTARKYWRAHTASPQAGIKA